MRGRTPAITADVLTAELRERLADINEEKAGTVAGKLAGSRSLGAMALARAHMATALHMRAAAIDLATSTTTQPGGEQ